MAQILSSEQIQLVQNNWDLIRKDSKNFGNELFINFFMKYPSYQEYFKSFANIPLDELRSSKRLLAHTTNVMYALTALVDNLEDPECIEEMLLKTGGNHSRRKLKIEMFHQLGDIFVALLEAKLGSNAFNEKVSNAWKKTYSLIVEGIKTGFSNSNQL